MKSNTLLVRGAKNAIKTNSQFILYHESFELFSFLLGLKSSYFIKIVTSQLAIKYLPTFIVDDPTPTLDNIPW